jgi:hypothetical protein
MFQRQRLRVLCWLQQSLAFQLLAFGDDVMLCYVHISRVVIFVRCNVANLRTRPNDMTLHK